MAKGNHNDPFKEGTFFDNFDAGIRALGIDQLPVAWNLARVNFRSTKERDKFLTVLRGMSDPIE
jgi:hypothetical protein